MQKSSGKGGQTVCKEENEAHVGRLERETAGDEGKARPAGPWDPGKGISLCRKVSGKRVCVHGSLIHGNCEADNPNASQHQ